MSIPFVQASLSANTSARLPHVDDRVRLLKSVPNTSLCRGQIGVVCSTWPDRSRPMFEVEFHSVDDDSDVSRRLLTAEQIEVEDPRDDQPHQ